MAILIVKRSLGTFVLYNASVPMEQYYASMVNHDLAL